MANTYIPLRDAKDPIAREFFAWVPEAVARRLPERINRDEVRTPMQWDAGPNAGFSAGGAAPWLPLNRDHERVNVASESAHAGSLLSLYRDLLALRRRSPALHSGTFGIVAGMPAGVLAYERLAGGPSGDRVLVIANMGHAPVAVPLDGDDELLVGTGEDLAIAGRTLRLAPDTAAVVAAGTGSPSDAGHP